MAFQSYSIANNCRSTLQTGINSSATSLTIFDAASPYNNPATPAAGYPGVLTFTDSLGAPTKYEIVTYTGIVDNMNGTRTLTGVTRGAEGSTAQAWTAGQIVYQAVTAAAVSRLGTMAEQNTTYVLVQEIEASGNVTVDGLFVNNAALISGYGYAFAGFVLGAEEDLGNSGASKSIDWETRKLKRLTISANTTLTFSAPPQGPCNIVLKVITHVSSGATFTIAWPASVKWVGGTIPNHRTGNSHTHLFELYYDGTTYWGSAKLNFS